MPGSSPAPSRFVSKLRSLARREAVPLHGIKLRVIDAALSDREIRSFADLGGIWAVDGGYTFHALENHAIDRAALVDDHISAQTAQRARTFPQLDLITGKFGDPEVRERVGSVGAIFLFDVLLHQVAPDWDTILELYAPQTSCFGIVNPQWVHGGETVRLVDLGRAEYEASVPDLNTHRRLFDRLDERHPDQDRPWRDVHEVWQWGITDADLRAKMRDLGFSEVHSEDGGPWNGLTRFTNRGFVFTRQS
jgi:hypothetical protein